MDNVFLVYLGVTIVAALTISPAAAGELVNCDFDHGWCGWNNNSHNCFNWTIDRGETTDKTSGPISDHTTDTSNGSYAVIYGRRARNASCTASIHSPDIRVNSNTILSFWYHMNGNGIGNLTVYTVFNGIRQNIWTKTGRQGPNWLLATVPISTWSYRIEFEATAKYHYGSDLAIDDVSLRTATPTLSTTVQSTQTTEAVGQLPIKCNFDSGLQRCGLNIDDAKNAMVAWRLKTGAELFKNVAVINGDNTTGMGSYLSLTVTDQRAMIGDKANLYLRVVEIQKMSCLTFAYSLPSNTSGSIQVFQTDVKTGEAKLVRQVSGYHGMRWESTFVQFFPSKDPFKIVIEGSFSGEPGSIAAIDDLQFVEEICDQYVSTPKPTTPATTPTLPPLVIRETTACQPKFQHLLSESSCDFTKDFCNYSRPKSPLKWIRLNKGQSHWSGIKVPERNRTELGYYVTIDLNDWMVPKNSTATLISTTVADDTVCLEFWYSLPSTKSNLKVDMETTWGHTESLLKKTSTVNKGRWMKRSLIINYRDNYKILFSTTKTLSTSFIGLDDVRIYTMKTLTNPTSRSTPGTSTTWSGSTPHAMDKTTIPTTIQKTTEIETTTTKSTAKKTTIQGPTESRQTTTPTTAIKTTKPKTIQKTTPIETTTTKSTTKKTTTQGATESTQTTTPTTGIKYTPPKITTSHRTTESGETTMLITQTENKSIKTTNLITSTTQTSGQTMIATKHQSTFTTIPTSTSNYSPNNKTSVTKSLSTKRKYTTKLSSATIPTSTPEMKKTTKYETKKPTPKSKITKSSKVENSSHATQKTKPPTKETTTNKNNILTKTDTNKSKQRLSEGAQVGIGISVSLLCVGVVFTVLYTVKNKMRKTAMLQKEETKQNEVGMVTFL